MNYIFIKGKLGRKYFKNLNNGKKMVLNTPIKDLKLKYGEEGACFYRGKNQLTPEVCQIIEEYGDILHCVVNNKKTAGYSYVDINIRTGIVTPVYKHRIANKFKERYGYLVDAEDKVYKFSQDSLMISNTDMKLNMSKRIKLTNSKFCNMGYVISKPVDGVEKYAVISEELEFLCPFVFDTPNIERSITSGKGLLTKVDNNDLVLGFHNEKDHIFVYKGQIFDRVDKKLSYRLLTDEDKKAVVVRGYNFDEDKSTVLTYVNKYLIKGKINDPCFLKVGQEQLDGHVESLLYINHPNYLDQLLLVERNIENVSRRGVIDQNNNQILPFEYDDINYSNDKDERVVVKDGKHFYWNIKTGKMINEKEKEIEIQKMREEYERLYGINNGTQPGEE